MTQEALSVIILSPRQIATGDPAGRALENIITNPISDGALCYVQTGPGEGEWQLDKSATDPPDGTTIVEPIGGPGRWFKKWGPGAGTAGFYQTIQKGDGAAMPQQPIFQFTGAGVVVTDDPGNNRTVITVPGGGGPGGGYNLFEANDVALPQQTTANFKSGGNVVVTGADDAGNNTTELTFDLATSIVLLGSITAGATISAPLFNGVPLTNAGAATNFLDEQGNYTNPITLAGGPFLPLSGGVMSGSIDMDSHNIVNAVVNGVTLSNTGSQFNFLNEEGDYVTAAPSPATTVTDASGAAGVVGISEEYAREDHAHQVVGFNDGTTAFTYGTLADGQMLVTNGGVIETQPIPGGGGVTTVQTTAAGLASAETITPIAATGGVVTIDLPNIKLDTNARGNTAIGVGTLALANLGTNGTVVGHDAAKGIAATNLTASNVLGSRAAEAAQFISESVVSGYRAAATATGIATSVIVGNAAGADGAGTIANCVLIGDQAGIGVTTSATDNTFIGAASAPGVASGVGNVGVGKGSGVGVATGDYNTIIGTGAGVVVGGSANLENIILGHDLLGHAGDNNVLIGSLGAYQAATTVSNYTSIRNLVSALAGHAAFGLGNTPSAAIETLLENQEAFVSSYVSNDEDPLFGLDSSQDGTNGALTELYTGDRDPNGSVVATRGSLYVQGGAAHNLWQNTDGATAWDKFEDAAVANPPYQVIQWNSNQSPTQTQLEDHEITYAGDSSGGAITMTLPSGGNEPKVARRIIVKDVDGSAATNNITVTGGANNIDGQTNYVIAIAYGSVTLQSLGPGNGYMVI